MRNSYMIYEVHDEIHDESHKMMKFTMKFMIKFSMKFIMIYEIHNDYLCWHEYRQAIENEKSSTGCFYKDDV